MTPDGLRVWLYYRLSKDDDKEQDSLKNQREIMESYARNHHHIIIGESSDDNLSGVHFDTRKGIIQLLEVADAKRIDAVLVKDFSRLGRNKALTPLLIEDLRKCNVRLISVTESLDSFNPNDDLVIGIKHVINDGYAKDTSRKVQTALYQKQQKGLLIIPPFGYRKIKDGKHTRVEIIDECADIVRIIFKLYVSGLGVNKICEHLIDRKVPSPAYYQKKYLDKNPPKTASQIGKQFLWSARSISFIITNEAYMGTLVNHKSSKNTIYRTRTNLPKDQQLRHEGFYPPIIEEAVFRRAQEVREHRNNNNVRASSRRPIYRYSGLLRCADCGATFTAKKRDGYIQYVCNTYHRISRKYCTSHRINDADLDEMVFNELARITFQAHRDWTAIDEQLNTWKRTRARNSNSIEQMENELTSLNDESKQIARQMLRDMLREKMYQEMIDENDRKADALRQQIDFLREANANSQRTFADMQSSLEIMKSVIESKELDNSQLIMLVEKISLKDAGNDKLDVELFLRGSFAVHAASNPATDIPESFTEGKAS